MAEYVVLPREHAVLPEPVLEWMSEQLHRMTDNVHIECLDTPINVVEYIWDGDTWHEYELKELSSGETIWLTLQPITSAFLRAKRPAGESVLVVRPGTDKLSYGWRIDNVHSLPLNAVTVEPGTGLSWSDPHKTLWSGTIQPGTPALGGPSWATTATTQTEYWFNAPTIPKPHTSDEEVTPIHLP